MSAKELILKTVNEMSDEMGMEAILDELAILAAIRDGEQAADEGRVLSHEAIKAKFAVDDCFADLVGAAGSSLDFWDHPLDDEDWNDA